MFDRMIIKTIFAVIASEAWQSPLKFFITKNLKGLNEIATSDFVRLAMTASRSFFPFFKIFYSIAFLCFLSSCGFKSEPQLAASRLQDSKNKCAELYITDSYSLSTNNDIAAKQVYKIEAKSPTDKRYNPANAYPVYHSFINNDNLVGNIMVNKNIRAKACQDYYLTNIKYFENDKKYK